MRPHPTDADFNLAARPLIDATPTVVDHIGQACGDMVHPVTQRPLLNVVFDAGSSTYYSRTGVDPRSASTEDVLRNGLYVLGRPGIEGAIGRLLTGTRRPPRPVRKWAWRTLHGIDMQVTLPDEQQ